MTRLKCEFQELHYRFCCMTLGFREMFIPQGSPIGDTRDREAIWLKSFKPTPTVINRARAIARRGMIKLRLRSERTPQRNVRASAQHNIEPRRHGPNRHLRGIKHEEDKSHQDSVTRGVY